MDHYGPFGHGPLEMVHAQITKLNTFIMCVFKIYQIVSSRTPQYNFVACSCELATARRVISLQYYWEHLVTSTNKLLAFVDNRPQITHISNDTYLSLIIKTLQEIIATR